MVFISSIVGYILGVLIIGGILFSILGKGSKPSSSEKSIYSWIGRIIGVFIGIALTA